jgi:hypothetical protein
MPITYDAWHILRLEFDVETGATKCYLDSKLVDSLVSQIVRNLQDVEAYLDIGIGASPNTAATAQVDEFRIDW